LKVDLIFKSPETKTKPTNVGSNFHSFGIQINGLDSANLNTQQGAENVENEEATEVSKFES
jgi:hypothetical protein